MSMPSFEEFVENVRKEDPMIAHDLELIYHATNITQLPWHNAALEMMTEQRTGEKG